MSREIVERLAERYKITNIIADGVEVNRDELDNHEYYNEIILEVERPPNNPDAPHAVAIINKSTAHFHTYTSEKYKIISGELAVIICGHANILSTGGVESVYISSCNIHYAISLLSVPAVIEIWASPRWDKEDHIFA